MYSLKSFDYCSVSPPWTTATSARDLKSWQRHGLLFQAIVSSSIVSYAQVTRNLLGRKARDQSESVLFPGSIQTMEIGGTESRSWNIFFGRNQTDFLKGFNRLLTPFGTPQLLSIFLKLLGKQNTRSITFPKRTKYVSRFIGTSKNWKEIKT